MNNWESQLFEREDEFNPFRIPFSNQLTHPTLFSKMNGEEDEMFLGKE